MGGYVVLGVIGLIALIAIGIVLSGIFTVGANQVGILTRKMTGTKLPEGHIIATNGENGIQADILMPGLYFKFPMFWSWEKVPVTTIEPGNVGVVEAIDGEPLAPHRILGDKVESNVFQDAKGFLSNGGKRGLQIDVLRPGTYRINTELFKIQSESAITIDKDRVGVAVASDGKPLPNGYIIAPEPQDKTKDHQHYQDGQMFIEAGGYRGTQLDTLQPGQYYINPALFKVTVFDVAEVPPGYVAVLRSNVGQEIAREHTSPDAPRSGVETILIKNKDQRGILSDATIPGKYNLNRIAFTPYLVPTSAVTIDWASEERIGTQVKDATNESVYKQFDPLKVTSMDGFQLKVNVRMVIRIEPKDAAFVIARFGSVDNLIDQIVHPLIDSSFRNKAGEKKAIDFFQSRTALQSEALEHAKEKFAQYNVEAQNLLIAYIEIPTDLLDTQTKKEIALQQQTQYSEQAKAQEKNIEVMEKTARANKQADVVNSELEIKIKENMAQARMREADGESTYLEKTNAATGKGLAEGYLAQKEAIGEQGTTLVNIITALADKGLKFVPEVQVGGGNEGLGGLIGALTATYGKKLIPEETK